MIGAICALISARPRLLSSGILPWSSALLSSYVFLSPSALPPCVVLISSSVLLWSSALLSCSVLLSSSGLIHPLFCFRPLLSS